MKRSLFFLLVLLVLPLSAMGADIKISDLPTATGVTDDDYLIIVDDPSGTPTTKKIAVSSTLATPINSDTNGMTQGEMTTAGMYGAMYFATGAGTWNLPAAAAGMYVCIYSTTAAEVVINPDSSDYIVLSGTALSAGDSIKNTSSAAGDYVCLIAKDATYWYTLGKSGTWADNN